MTYFYLNLKWPDKEGLIFITRLTNQWRGDFILLAWTVGKVEVHNVMADKLMKKMKKYWSLVASKLVLLASKYVPLMLAIDICILYICVYLSCWFIFIAALIGFSWSTLNSTQINSTKWRVIMIIGVSHPNHPPPTRNF